MDICWGRANLETAVLTETMSPESGLAVISCEGEEVEEVGADEDSRSAAWPGVVVDSVAVGAEEEGRGGFCFQSW